MTTEIYFKDIKDEIMKMLNSARHSIKLAMAWLTDEDIIRVLTQKSQQGLTVAIVISNSIENFRRTDKFKGFLCTDGQLYISDQSFVHHKFCLIDESVFINGSYNWSYSAQNNEENITVSVFNKELTDDTRMIQKINAKFTYLCNVVCKNVINYAQLTSYYSLSKQSSDLLILEDEAEMVLRQEFEDHVKRLIATAKAEKIPSNYDRLFERMRSDGGGVYFVRRIIREEMQQREMKTGFNKLVDRIPHRVELSLEYLVCQPQYVSLFKQEEVLFCKNLMRQYNLAV